MLQCAPDRLVYGFPRRQSDLDLHQSTQVATPGFYNPVFSLQPIMLYLATNRSQLDAFQSIPCVPSNPQKSAIHDFFTSWWFQSICRAPGHLCTRSSPSLWPMFHCMRLRYFLTLTYQMLTDVDGIGDNEAQPLSSLVASMTVFVSVLGRVVEKEFTITVISPGLLALVVCN